MMTVGGLSKIFGSSPTFSGAGTFLRLSTTGTTASDGITFTGAGDLQRVSWPTGYFIGISGGNFTFNSAGVSVLGGDITARSASWGVFSVGTAGNALFDVRLSGGSLSAFRTTGSSTTSIAEISGTLDSQYTPVGNLGAGEDVLHTFSLPANALLVTGRSIRYHGCGTIANNVNAKTLKIYFGSSMISVTIPISIAGDWDASAWITRTGASTQRYKVEIIVSNTATNAVSGAFVSTGTLAETETSAITIKATATATTDNDVTQNLSTVEYI